MFSGRRHAHHWKLQLFPGGRIGDTPRRKGSAGAPVSMGRVMLSSPASNIQQANALISTEHPYLTSGVINPEKTAGNVFARCFRGVKCIAESEQGGAAMMFDRSNLFQV